MIYHGINMTGFIWFQGGILDFINLLINENMNPGYFCPNILIVDCSATSCGNRPMYWLVKKKASFCISSVEERGEKNSVHNINHLYILILRLLIDLRELI